MPKERMFQEVREGIIFPNKGKDLLPFVDLNKVNIVTRILKKASLIKSIFPLKNYHSWKLLAQTGLLGDHKKRDNVELVVQPNNLNINVSNSFGISTIELGQNNVFIKIQKDTFGNKSDTEAIFNLSVNMDGKLSYEFFDEIMEREMMAKNNDGWDFTQTEDNINISDFVGKSFKNSEFCVEDFEIDKNSVSFYLKFGNSKRRQIMVPRGLEKLS